MCTRTVLPGAVVEGRDPGQARVLSSSSRVELEQLEQWALRHTSTEDRLVLEASGNAFAVAARLRTIGGKVEILESHRAGKWVRSTVPTIGSMRSNRAHLFERALAHRVATGRKDLGAARDLQCVSGGGEGIDPGQATTARDVERTLCALGEGLPPLSSQRDQALGCAAGMDAGPHNVVATIARHSGGRASASEAAAPARGPGNGGRG